MESGAGERRTLGRRGLSTGAAIVFLTLVVLGPLVPRYNAQPASRYALTGALADHGTIDLGRYSRMLGVDHALYRGQLRSDKAVGGPLLAVPFYAIGRAFGAEPATALRGEGDLGLWWTTFWTSLVPFALLVLLMYRFALRFAPEHALVAAFAIGFGTMMLPHAVNLYGHVLAAAFGFGALVVSEHPRPSTGRLLAAGALASAAVAVEYHAAIVAIVVFGAVALRERARSLWMIAGALPAMLVVAVYQWRVFGAWFHTPFAYYAGELNGTTEGGFSFPGARNINAVFVGTRGLLLVSPVVLVAIGGAIWLARRGDGEVKRQAWIALFITGAYIVLSAGWSGTPLLEEPGPRYAIPALPFLVVPLAVVWPRCRRLAIAATVVGATLMTAAAFTFILVQVGHSPITYLRYVANGKFATTLWSMAFGPALGTVCYLASVVVAFALVLRWSTIGADAPQPERALR